MRFAVAIPVPASTRARREVWQGEQGLGEWAPSMTASDDVISTHLPRECRLRARLAEKRYLRNAWVSDPAPAMNSY